MISAQRLLLSHLPQTTELTRGTGSTGPSQTQPSSWLGGNLPVWEKSLSNEGVREAWSELKLKENSKFLCQAVLLLTEGFGNSIKSLWDSAIYLLQQPAQRTQQWMAAQRPQKERFCQAVFGTLQCTEAVLPSKERTVQNCTLTGINEEAEACWKYHSQLFDVLNASFSWAGCKKPKMTVRGKKRSGLGK